MTKRKAVDFYPFLIFLVVITSTYFLFSTPKKPNNILESITPAPTPTPYQFPYRPPIIPKNNSYRTVIVGDSIVNALGVNANTLRLMLIKYYPNSEFVNYNYGYPATSILSLYPRLTETTKNNTTENQAILNEYFELIIIESFGYNPLSQFSLEEGLKRQYEELEKSVRAILKEKPNAALAFLTPIALDPTNFAKTTRDLAPEVRKSWVDERVAYINNHKQFAKDKGIPLIDVYSMSLKPDGVVNNIYISNDFIHPSAQGVELISKAIADYIFANKIFPE